MTTHPIDSPNFRGCDGPPVWYLSHPLAPDGKYTFLQNMDHIVKLIEIFYEHDFPVIAPYHTICLALDDRNLEHQRMGLECDYQVVKALKRIVLCGHKLSKGMEGERNVILKEQEVGKPGFIVNLIGVPDEGIRLWLKSYNESAELVRPNV